MSTNVACCSNSASDASSPKAPKKEKVEPQVNPVLEEQVATRVPEKTPEGAGRAEQQRRGPAAVTALTFPSTSSSDDHVSCLSCIGFRLGARQRS